MKANRQPPAKWVVWQVGQSPKCQEQALLLLVISIGTTGEARGKGKAFPMCQSSSLARRSIAGKSVGRFAYDGGDERVAVFHLAEKRV